MAARFADRRVLAALFLLAWPAMAPAQSLPGHFQYSELRHFDDGTTCVAKTDVAIRGSSVFLAPLSKVCEDPTRGSSGDEDEGFIFPLGSTASGPKNCKIAVGQDPTMTCTDGETKSVLGFATEEPLRVEAFTTASAKWTGSQLVLDLKSSEIRYTMAGGSGRKPQKVRIQFHFEYSFSGSACKADRIVRERTFNSRPDRLTGVTPQSCQILR